MRVYLGVTEQTLGEVLRKYRTANGYTQKKVADFLGIDRTTYTKYETVRKPELEVLMKLSAFYDVTVDSFLEEFFADSKGDSKYLIANSPEKRELVFLTPEEKQLIEFYRDSIRKGEILDKAQAVWIEDTKLLEEIK